jgi:LPXTG-site transpeptidase (sortase) family protein
LDIPITQTSSITLSKEASPTTYDTVSQSIGYTYTITNTGNVTLAGPFTVKDDKATVTCADVPTGGLVPLSTLSCSASYTITQPDIESGSVTNKATASGSGVSSDEMQATVNAVQNPELTLEKTGTLDMSVVSPSDQANVGDKITYTFKVTNSGNMTLYNIDLADLVSGVSTEGGPISSLAPGASDSTTFTGSYTLTAADIINGSFTNNASISGETKAETPVSASDDDTQDIAQVPSIALTKVGTLDQTVVDPKTLVNPGDKITYAFTVKNTGNLDLSNVTLSDALPGVTLSGGPIALLHPGEEDDSTFKGVYAVTQDDIDAGKVENSATVSGTPAVGSAVTDSASDTQNISNDPIIGIAKQITPDPVKVTPGTWDVTYSILVKNFGNVVLNKVQVTDDLTTVFPSPTTYVVQSITSTDLTVDTAYDGTTKTNLLTGTDSLAIGGSGTITVVVRVVPASSGPFNNTAVANAESSDGGKTTTDQSQVGSNPDPDDDGNPANNNDPTPTSFGDHPFDPPSGTKTVDTTGNPNMVWSMVWINNSNIIDLLSEVHDPIPEGTTFVPNLVDSGYPVPTGAPVGSSSYGVACSAGTSTTTITTLCYYEGPTTEHPLGQVIWAGTLAADLGVTDPAAAANAIHITFTTTNDANIKSVTNSATVDADLNGNGSITDEGEQNVATASAAWQEAPVVSTSPEQSASHLPITGFAPGIITKLPDQPKALAYSSLGEMWIEIPSLNMQSTVVGVPVTESGWDVSWLGKSTGWLNGTAYPTHLGNSVLTAHINDTNGHPGPFASIDKLKYGDQIIIHAWNQKYVYEVRETKVISATNNSEALKHKDLSWITLLTCRDFDEKTGTYLERYLVRAVLIKVQ